MREERGTPGRLLRRDQVRQVLEAGRSTGHRMAGNGRLTEVVTPCPRYTGRQADPGLLPWFRPGC